MRRWRHYRGENKPHERKYKEEGNVSCGLSWAPAADYSLWKRWKSNYIVLLLCVWLSHLFEINYRCLIVSFYLTFFNYWTVWLSLVCKNILITSVKEKEKELIQKRSDGYLCHVQPKVLTGNHKKNIKKWKKGIKKRKIYFSLNLITNNCNLLFFINDVNCKKR